MANNATPTFKHMWHAATSKDVEEEDFVLLMDAQIMLSKVECALSMEQSQRSNNATRRMHKSSPRTRSLHRHGEKITMHERGYHRRSVLLRDAQRGMHKYCHQGICMRHGSKSMPMVKQCSRDAQTTSWTEECVLGMGQAETAQTMQH
eukprot:scaffold843_cov77-Skeletonema_dohrnii-CCMP3373.AAC.4